ncbi:MAG: FeoA domain-containing protein [Euryarchaeota archaeon]|nr:FeoA domain-containing protein [Euryarchaeota archaeon]
MSGECVSNDMVEEKRSFITGNYSDSMPLSQLDPGERGRVMAVEGGHGIRQKLLLRGLSEGSMIRVISCYGPVTVEVDRHTVSMGRGMAQKVIVRREW